MKLAPRVRRERSDYLVDNAADLKLGYLFLNWGKGKRKSTGTKKKAAPTAAAKTKVRAAKPEPKKRQKAAVAAAAKVSKAKIARKAKKSAPTPRKKKAAPPPPPTPKKVAAKAAAPQKKSAVKAAAPPPPTKQTKKAAAPATKRATSYRPRSSGPSRSQPPVIPNPVPTPALPARAPASSADDDNNASMITITVRTMSNISFHLVVSLDILLYELKRQILDLIAAIAASPQYNQQLPLLVMNGRALAPDHATLRALGISAHSTVYCFPEPS